MDPAERERFNALIEEVIGAVYEVARTLGAGFLEKVYERALVKELRLRGLRVAAQVPIQVSYKGEGVGDYFVAEQSGQTAPGPRKLQGVHT